jgi:hypothetical protein
MSNKILITLLILSPLAYSTEIIIDNGEEGTFSTGTWNDSAASGKYGADSKAASNNVNNINATYEWNYQLTENRYAEVYIWYPVSAIRTSNARYTIYTKEELITIDKDQKVNGGQWIYLGRYLFETEIKIQVKKTLDDGDYLSADAVKYVLDENPANLETTTLLNTEQFNNISTLGKIIVIVNCLIFGGLLCLIVLYAKNQSRPW